MRYRYSIRLYGGLGELWLRRGNLDKAESFVEQSLDLSTHSGSQKNLVRGWRLKGEIALGRRRWEEAEAWLRKALRFGETIGNPPQLWKTYFALAEFYAAAGKPVEARQAYQAARGVIGGTLASLRHPTFRTSLENASLTQRIYKQSRSDA